MTLHIAVDLDDVVLDFVGNLVNIVNTEYGTDLDVTDVVEWDLSKALDPILGESWWGWWKRRDWLWAQAPAIPGAIGGLERLRQAGHYLEIVTSKPRWAEAQTWRWLGKWRPPVHRVTIVDADAHPNKADFTDADLLIDDKPSNIEDFVNAGRTGLLFTRPHNAEYGRLDCDPSWWTRVANWHRVIAAIEEGL
jgi:5'(3')-deoxyribonucleotidase